MNDRKRSVLPSAKLAIGGMQDELWFTKIT